MTDNVSKVSAVVLAGGKSRRLGRDKAVELIGGEPLIARVIRRVSQVADDVVVVVGDAERGERLPLPEHARVAVDLYPGGGSLGGIFTGLKAARSDWALVVACDMPFVNMPLFHYILSLREGVDAVVPVLDDRPEPTHAAYSKVCLPHMERLLKAGSLKIAGFFDQVNLRTVPQEDVEKLDPDHLSFFNVNTTEDLDRALSLAAEGR